jgi:hypothetical protein
MKTNVKRQADRIIADPYPDKPIIEELGKDLTFLKERITLLQSALEFVRSYVVTSEQSLRLAENSALPSVKTYFLGLAYENLSLGWKARELFEQFMADFQIPEKIRHTLRKYSDEANNNRTLNKYSKAGKTIRMADRIMDNPQPDPFFKNIADKFELLNERWESLETVVTRGQEAIQTCITLANKINQSFSEKEKEIVFNLIVSIFVERIMWVEEALKQTRIKQTVEEVVVENKRAG